MSHKKKQTTNKQTKKHWNNVWSQRIHSKLIRNCMENNANVRWNCHKLPVLLGLTCNTNKWKLIMNSKYSLFWCCLEGTTAEFAGLWLCCLVFSTADLICLWDAWQVLTSFAYGMHDKSWLHLPMGCMTSPDFICLWDAWQVLTSFAHEMHDKSEKFVRKWVQNFLTSQTTVTMHKDQGHLNWYLNADFRSGYYHTKFERNWSVNARTWDSVKHFF